MPTRSSIARRPLPLLCGLLLCAASPAFAGDRAEGSVQLDHADWTVADGIAWHENGEIAIAFSDQPFDRAAMREEGGVDGFDVMRHPGSRLGFTVADGEPGMCLDATTRAGDTIYSGSSCNSEFPAAITIDAQSPERIAGRMHWGEAGGEHVHLSFDLAIEAAPAEAPAEAAGDPLPADGGAPGKALLAHFAALAEGDWERYKAGSHPDRRVMLEEQEAAGEHLEMFGFLQSYAPRNVRITGGSVSGEVAQVTYTGEQQGAPAKGTADLMQDGGTWYVIGTMTE